MWRKTSFFKSLQTPTTNWPLYVLGFPFKKIPPFRKIAFFCQIRSTTKEKGKKMNQVQKSGILRETTTTRTTKDWLMPQTTTSYNIKRGKKYENKISVLRQTLHILLSFLFKNKGKLRGLKKYWNIWICLWKLCLWLLGLFFPPFHVVSSSLPPPFLQTKHDLNLIYLPYLTWQSALKYGCTM